MRSIFTLFLLLFSTTFAAFAQSQQMPKHVDMAAQIIEVEKKTLLAISLKNDKKWHTYWKNPGDAGLAIEFEFYRDEQALVFEEKEWPRPLKFIESGNLVTYGYEGTNHFFFEIDDEKRKALKKSTLDIYGKWLVCKDICIPGEASLKLELDEKGFGSNQHELKIHSSELIKAFKKLPAMAQIPKDLEIFLAESSEPNQLVLQYILKDIDPQQLDKRINLILPFLTSPLDFKHEQLRYDPKEKTLYGKMPLDWDGEYEDPPLELPVDGKFKTPLTIRFLYTPSLEQNSLIVEKTFEQFSVGEQSAFDNFFNSLETLDQTNSPAMPSTRSLGLILLFAFLGGVILNLMPCVLPVISLKLFGLIVHSDEAERKILKHNLFYTFGVLVTFWILALFVLIIKASGEQIGWGFQLQSPGFVFVMMIVMFIMALNMFGLFEFTTPGGKKLGSVQIKQGNGADFFNGVLATILSTPCSAPFLGAALTFAFTTTSFNIFLVLTFVGLGLSFPFILTGAFPKLIKFLPRPGKWMEQLKKFLGLSLALTFVWLYDVLSAQIDYAFAGITINSIFVMLFFAFFMRKHISKNAILSFVAFLIPLLLSASLLKNGGLELSEKQSGSISNAKLDWQPWSEQRMGQLKGKWVFIDFTADWCLTCKVNEKLVLNTDGFQALKEKYQLELLLGDWTRRDADIANFLAGHGIVGVPAYFIQKPNGELISLGEVISLERIEKHLRD